MPSPDYQASRTGDTISIAGQLDFQTATSAVERVVELMQEPGDLVIDLAGVTNSNSAALALLIEWLAVAQRENRQLSFTNVPDSLRQISSVCQVDSLI